MFRFVFQFQIKQVNSHFVVVCLGFEASPGRNFTQILHLYFTRVAIVSLAEKNSYTFKIQL